MMVIDTSALIAIMGNERTRTTRLMSCSDQNFDTVVERRLQGRVSNRPARSGNDR